VPDLNIFCPATLTGLDSLFIECLFTNFPSYIRIPKGPGIQGNICDIKNRDSLVMSYGSASEYALNFAQTNNCEFLLVERLKPLVIDEEVAANFHKTIVIEDHFAAIGLYSKMCQLINEKRFDCYVTLISPIDYSLVVQNNF